MVLIYSKFNIWIVTYLYKFIINLSIELISNRYRSGTVKSPTFNSSQLKETYVYHFDISSILKFIINLYKWVTTHILNLLQIGIILIPLRYRFSTFRNPSLKSLRQLISCNNSLMNLLPCNKIVIEQLDGLKTGNKIFII